MYIILNCLFWLIISVTLEVTGTLLLPETRILKYSINNSLSDLLRYFFLFVINAYGIYFTSHGLLHLGGTGDCTDYRDEQLILSIKKQHSGKDRDWLHRHRAGDHRLLTGETA